MDEIAGLQTTNKCDGCGKAIDLLKNHLTVSYKVMKQTLVAPVTPQRDANTAHEPDNEEEFTPYLGTRSGVGKQFLFHDWGCALDKLKGLKDKELKLEYNRDDSDEYGDRLKALGEAE